MRAWLDPRPLHDPDKFLDADLMVPPEEIFEKIATELFDLNIWSDVEWDDVPSYTFWLGDWIYLWFGYMGYELIKEWYSIAKEDFIDFQQVYELCDESIQKKMLYGLDLLKEGIVNEHAGVSS